MDELAPRDAVTERDAASRLGLSYRTLQRWRMTGVAPIRPLPGLGRLVRYATADIDRYLRVQREGCRHV